MPIRRPRIGYLSKPASSDSNTQEQDGTSLVDFLSVLQETHVTLLPISPHKGLRIIGRGLSGLIQQSSADILTDFAFKHGIPSGHARDSKKDQNWQHLITEVRILRHPPIKKSRHVIELVGVSFSVDSSTASPVLVTLKANKGDLSSFVLNENQTLEDDGICIKLVAEISEALHLLHGCGVAHGDIKPENVLVEQSDVGVLKCLLTDFGSSVVQGQKRLPTSSEPWSAPEVRNDLDSVGFEFLRQADLFSFGLVCLVVLVPLTDLERANLCFIRRLDSTEHQWAGCLDDWKVKKSKTEQESLQEAIWSLVQSVNISAKRKGLLNTIIKATLQPQPGNRQMPWAEMLPSINEFLSQDSESASTIPTNEGSDVANHFEHLNFSFSRILGELDDTDYIVRRSIAQDLLYKADHTECSTCREHCAFQAAVCCSLAFGAHQGPENAQQWLGKSRRNDKDLHVAIESIRDAYRVPGHVSKDVLDQLGLRMLVCANRIQEYQASGRMLEAETCLRQEIDARAEVLGGNHRGLTKPSSELARVLVSQSRFSEAEKRQEQVVEILSLHFGERYLVTLLAKLDLAQIFADRLVLKKAELLYEAVIPKLQGIVSAENPDVASALQNFANLRVSLGKLQEAVSTMKQVIAIRSKQLSPTHPATINAELNLIIITRLQGNTKHAAILIEQLEETVQCSLSKDDILRASIDITKAAIHIDSHKLVQAEVDVGHALELLDRLQIAQGDALRLEALSVLASVHGESRKFPEQEQILRNILQQSIDKQNRWYLMNKICLAENLFEQGQYLKAHDVAIEVTSSEDGINMKTPREVLASYKILAKVAFRQGDRRKALQIRQQCLDSCQQHLGPENDLTLEAKYMLASGFEDLGDYREGQRQAEDLLHYLKDSNSLTSWRKCCDLARLLVRVCLAQSKFDEAERYCREGLQWALETLGESHLKTITLYRLLAKTYLSRGRDTEAELILSDEFLELVKGSEMEIYVLEDLATLREHQGRKVEASHLRNQALELCSSILGESHPESLSLMGNALLAELNGPLSDELESRVLENIEKMKQSIGNSHRSTIKSMMRLASAYGKARRFDDSERLIKEIDANSINTEHQDPARYASNLTCTAEIYFDMGRYDAAEKLEFQALEIRKKLFGEDHEVVLRTMNNLATTRFGKGDLLGAEDLLRQVLTVREPKMLASKKSTLSYLTTKVTLAATIYTQSKEPEFNLGRMQEARNMYAQVLEVAEHQGMPINLVSIWRASFGVIDFVLQDTQS